MKVEVKEFVSYNGHSLRANGNVNVSFKAKFSQLRYSIDLMNMLNEDITLYAKLPEQKAIKLGVFRIKEIKVDHYKESTIKFNSLNDFVEVDNLNNIVSEEEFLIKAMAEIEDEEEENENE